MVGCLTGRCVLSGRERVLRCLSGAETDRIPTFFHADAELTASYSAVLGVSDLATHFEADMVQLKPTMEKVIFPDFADAEDAVQVDSADWPDGAAALDMDACVERAQWARGTGRAVCGGAWASIFTHSRRRMGEERYLLALYDNPELIERVVARLTDYFLAVNTRYFDACAQYLDLFYFGSDFGTQLSMFISPEHYRRFFKPHMKRLVDHAKGYGLRVMFHTCGAVGPIIGDLAEIGVDILDPVQVSAAGMAPATLAREFKGKIAFHGGISTQTTLPFATPADVRAAVRRTLEVLGPERVIIGPDQQMIGDIPLENVVAMYEAAREFRP